MTSLRIKLFFVLLFSCLVLIGSQINFSQVLGANNQFFTLFQFFGPIAGSILGPIVGAGSVLLAEIANFLMVGKEVSLINLARLAPMLVAAYYFGVSKRKDWSIIVPVFAMALFMLHPVGSQAWMYALYWLIPIGVRVFAPNRLFFKSLGATFMAHSVGSVIWLYALPSTPELWLLLIPIVALERCLFALGISGSYLAINTLLHKLENRLPKGIIHINPKYDLTKMFSFKT
ncbi:hypothetical protein KKE06_04990 [Candidatus Micrarchaeota archaeon]|nr:hypothetical protein [Candidatus Micrarchaeota archaeon]MBU1930246.1 hypothetical protein [Candidatus Micrarchaeota archaeon]